MRYPIYNATRVDTGLRKMEIVHVVSDDDVKKFGGEYIVSLCSLKRRIDASTTEGDIWETDKLSVFAGSVHECVSYINGFDIPADSRMLYCSTGKMIWGDIPAMRKYIDTLTPLCDDGQLLGDYLNYAAVIKDGYAPYAPDYDPDKRPVV